ASGCSRRTSRVREWSSVAGPAALNWGCESSAATSKYVKSVSTGANGEITVTAQGFNDTNIDTKIVTLVPYVDASTAMSSTNDIEIGRAPGRGGVVAQDGAGTEELG